MPKVSKRVPNVADSNPTSTAGKSVAPVSKGQHINAFPGGEMTKEQQRLVRDWTLNDMRSKAKAWSMIYEGEDDKALTYLRDAYESTSVGAGTLIVDIDLRLGRFKAAYEDFMEYPQAHDGSLAPRLSLVASLNGQVFNGQRNYLIDYIVKRWGQDMQELLDTFPVGDSPKAVAALSYVALGDTIAQFDNLDAISDFEHSLKLDPGNPMTLATLALAYIEDGRYLDGLKALEEALLKAPSPAYKESLKRQIAVAAARVKSRGNSGKPNHDLARPPLDSQLP
ncbi:MAG TPA: tetratricopeptide repeat protein [Fimbriimonadaceae bacterium]